jgi:hypothetical protein
MLIKSVIKKEETIEKEISLPYFCKYYDNLSEKFTYFKLTEDRVIDVMDGKNYKNISSYGHGVNDYKIAQSIECDEQEFNEAYHKALFEIGKYVPLPEISEPIPGTKEWRQQTAHL